MLNWNNITLDTYLRLKAINESPDTAFQLVEVLYKVESARDMRQDDFFDKLNAAMAFLNTKPDTASIKLKTSLSGGLREYKMHANASSLTAGQFIDFQGATRDGNLKAMVGIIYDAKNEAEVEDVASTITMPQVWGLVSFFVKASQVLLKNTKFCSRLQAETQGEILKALRQGEAGLLFGTNLSNAAGSTSE